MSETLIIALLSLGGTLIGSLSGILTANRLTVYRIEQLEKKVDRHNSVIERTFRLEKAVGELETRVRLYHQREVK